MTDDSKATPRPWRAYNNGVCWQIDGELNAIVTTQFCYSHSPKADAALIVAAVNAHDALVAECDRLRQKVEDLEADASNDYGKYLALKHDYDRLRQVLEEAAKDACIAWRVLVSMHRDYCKGRDPLYTTRHSDFTKSEKEADERLAHIREVLGDGDLEEGKK